MKYRILFILSVILFFTVSISDGLPLEFVDEVGRHVVIPFPPRRIISLAPNITETLFRLGLDKEIVGVSTHCDYPEEAKTKIRVGGYLSPNLESIVSLKPDLIVATGIGNSRDTVERLRDLGLPTYVIFPKNFDEILRSIRHLGQISGREKEARGIIQGMEKRRQRVKELTRGLPRPKIFVQVGDAPMITVGRGSFGDDLIRLAGGDNIAGKEKEMYPRLGIEEVLRKAPEVILISSMNPMADYQRIFQEWARWKTIPAVKEGRIHLIDSDLIDRPSPRIIDGLEEMAGIFHPQQFKKQTGVRGFRGPGEE